MIDEVIKEAETSAEYRLNQMEQLKRDKRLLEERLKTLHYEVLGWEAYLQALRKEAGK